MSDDRHDTPEHDPAEILELLAADVAATLGWPTTQAEGFVRRHGGRRSAGLLLVAEDVQQRLHDDWIDTTWPACPDHPHHPLRPSEKLPAFWTCPTTGRTVCALGDLASVVSPG